MGRKKKKLRKEARRRRQERVLNCIEAAFDLAASFVQTAGAFGLMILICIAAGCASCEHAQVPISYAPGPASSLGNYEWAYMDDKHFFTDSGRYLYMDADASTSVDKKPLIVVRTPDGFELFAESDSLKGLKTYIRVGHQHWPMTKLHVVDDLDRLDFDRIAKARKPPDVETSPIVLEEVIKPIWWAKSMTEFNEEEGIAAIQFLQGLADIPETAEQAKSAWAAFSDSDKENTIMFYRRLKPRPDAKDIPKEMIASCPSAQQRVTRDLARE